MSTEYRALLLELVEAWESYSYADAGDATDRMNEAVKEARAALAQTAPVEPTDEELFCLEDLRDAWNAQADAVNSWDELGMDEIIWFAQQQALSRWGRPAIAPATWLPMEQAPKDGTKILGRAGDEIAVVYWYDSALEPRPYWSLAVCGSHAEDSEWTPSEWMSLPGQPAPDAPAP